MIHMPDCLWEESVPSAKLQRNKNNNEAQIHKKFQIAPASIVIQHITGRLHLEGLRFPAPILISLLTIPVFLLWSSMGPLFCSLHSETRQVASKKGCFDYSEWCPKIKRDPLDILALSIQATKQHFLIWRKHFQLIHLQTDALIQK